MMKLTCLAALLVCYTSSLSGAVIGIDAVHASDSAHIMGTGSNFSAFRAEITNLGNTIVPLTSFNSADLAGLDALIIRTNNTAFSSHPYSTGEQAAILSFTKKATFVSDTSLWGVAGDRPISFGDNRKLLDNIVNFSIGGGVLFLADTGDYAEFNQMTSQFGVTFSSSQIDGDGRTVSGFVSSPITTGISTVGVDFQSPLTIHSPAIDLTTSSVSGDEILAFVPGTSPGDYNRDGHVNAADIKALQQALTNLPLYKSTYGVSDADLLQMNQFPGESTSTLNNSDLQALLNYLRAGHGSAEPVPEPSTLALLTLGGVIAIAAKHRAT